MLKKIDLSIVIVNYEAKKELIECIKSIYDSQSKLSLEIIVVDNSSRDFVSKDLKRLFPKVKYIKSEKNLGYGAGNNLGVKNAIGEFIFILNPDTKLISGKLESLIKILRSDKKIGVVSPLLLNSKNKPFDKQGVRLLTPKRAIFSLSFLSLIFKKNKVYQDYYYSSWNKKSLKEVDVVPGTAFVIRKPLFEKIGGFDEKFFLFFEEFDLCKRLRNAGFRNYITPDVKFFHAWGVSTSKNEKTENYFLKSRFYYFKKNYGLVKTISTEFFLRINSYSIILGFFLIWGFFLRTFKLSTLMSFISDQGSFYLPARDMVIHKTIPLVGALTSHPWLHHGPLWIYYLAIMFWLFKFNPIVPAYFIAILGTITIFIFYLVVNSMFGKKIALLTSIMYATAPIIVNNARLPYHTSPIPFFVIILFYLTYRWIKGSVWVFPIITFLLGVLYNHEITNFVFFITIGALVFYGFVKKYDWYKKLLNPKIIIASIISFSIPMLPFFIYDTTHGYRQTLGFLVWVVYRIVKFPLSLVDSRFKSSGSSPSTIPQLFSYYRDLVFSLNNIVVVIILALTIIFIILYFSKFIKFGGKKLISLKRKMPTAYGLLFLFFFISITGLSIHRVPIDADTLLFFPFLIILTSMMFLWIFRNKFILALIVVIGISISNSYYLLSTNLSTNINGHQAITISDQLAAVDKVILLSNGKPYNIVGRGALSDFESFTKGYQYLLWWKGNPPQERDVSLKIVIWESPDGVKVYKK